jgi:hypothetical protein
MAESRNGRATQEPCGLAGARLARHLHGDAHLRTACSACCPFRTRRPHYSACAGSDRLGRADLGGDAPSSAVARLRSVCRPELRARVRAGVPPYVRHHGAASLLQPLRAIRGGARHDRYRRGPFARTALGCALRLRACGAADRGSSRPTDDDGGRVAAARAWLRDRLDVPGGSGVRDVDARPFCSRRRHCCPMHQPRASASQRWRRRRPARVPASSTRAAFSAGPWASPAVESCSGRTASPACLCWWGYPRWQAERCRCGCEQFKSARRVTRRREHASLSAPTTPRRGAQGIPTTPIQKNTLEEQTVGGTSRRRRIHGRAPFRETASASVPQVTQRYTPDDDERRKRSRKGYQYPCVARAQPGRWGPTWGCCRLGRRPFVTASSTINIGSQRHDR